MASDRLQRYLFDTDGLYLLEDVAGTNDMSNPEALCDFINFATENFPADRYQLVFWNHGGGTIGGFGVDEVSGNTQTLYQIDQALTQAGVKFDYIGFDACLMATIETAFMLEKHADYLIASEESEPGYGWYYTDFITALSENPSMEAK